MSSSTNPGVAGLLRGVHRTLRELTLAPRAGPPCLVATFPIAPRSGSCRRSQTSPSTPLRCKTPRSSSPCWKTLVPANGICTVAILLAENGGHVEPQHLRELLGTFDARMAEIVFPALRRVGVRPPSIGPAHVTYWEEKKTLYVEALARLSQRRPNFTQGRLIWRYVGPAIDLKVYKWVGQSKDDRRKAKTSPQNADIKLPYLSPHRSGGTVIRSREPAAMSLFKCPGGKVEAVFGTIGNKKLLLEKFSKLFESKQKGDK
ncbi:hypothetical protein B0H13DRAFT_1916473 [Mycena leptocephala]|nr:hypothetical protein B0H13DRAFT_1916473 [Mycena leptocephala]